MTWFHYVGFTCLFSFDDISLWLAACYFAFELIVNLLAAKFKYFISVGSRDDGLEDSRFCGSSANTLYILFILS